MNLAKLVAVFAAAVVAVFLLMPQEKLDGMKESWLRVKSDPGQACLDFERRDLKDPDSARLLNTLKRQGSDVTITYKAKNSYGAFGQAEVVCSVDDGKVNEFGTKLVREHIRLDASIKQMDENIKCLERRNAFMTAGKWMEEATRLAGGPCDSASR